MKRRSKVIAACVIVLAVILGVIAGSTTAFANVGDPRLTATFDATAQVVHSEGADFAPKSSVRLELSFGDQRIEEHHATNNAGRFSANTPVPTTSSDTVKIRAHGKKRIRALVRSHTQSVTRTAETQNATHDPSSENATSTSSSPSSTSIPTSTPTSPPATSSSTVPTATASPTKPPTTIKPIAGKIIFDAQFVTKGFAAYPDTNPNNVVVGVDMKIVSDPKNPNRKVALFDSSRGLTAGNTYPRAGVTTGLIMQQGQEYWNSYSFMVDEKLTGTDWNGIWTGAFGAPYNGPSPLGTSVGASSRDGYNRLHFSRSTSKGGISWRGMDVRVGSWVQVITNYKLGFEDTGWVSMWINTGPGPNNWVKILDHQRVATLAPGATGSQYSSVGAYGEKPHQIYVGAHRIAQGDPRLVALDDFGTWNGVLP